MQKEEEFTGFRLPKSMNGLTLYMQKAIKIIFTHNNKNSLSIRSIELMRTKFDLAMFSWENIHTKAAQEY